MNDEKQRVMSESSGLLQAEGVPITEESLEEKMELVRIEHARNVEEMEAGQGWHNAY